MATKAEKRRAALAKREAFMKEERERGLAALAESRRNRKADEAKNLEEVLETKRRRIGTLVQSLQRRNITVAEYLEAADIVMGAIGEDFLSR